MFDLPLHPIFVHFPVALLTLAWLFLLAHYWTGAERPKALSAVMETVGIIALPVTIVTGLIDTSGISFLTSPNWGLPLVWHFLLASGGAVAFTAHGLMRLRASRAGSDLGISWDLGLSTTGFWLIVFAGLLAGELVYGA